MLNTWTETWRNKHIPISQSHGTVNHASNNTINNHLQGASTHANHVGAQQQQSQHISIGTWPSGTSTGLSARPIEVPKHQAIARTGTNLSMEEREVETSRSQPEPSSGGSMSSSVVADTRSSNANAASSHDELPADNTCSILHSREVYRLEWFSVLVVMLLLLICEFIIYFLIVQAHTDSFFVQTLLVAAIWACSLILFGVTLYTGVFVFLTEYHTAVGKLLDRYLFLSRRVQQMSLRVVTYSCSVLWTLCMGALLYIFLF